jgi:hypothetical protein
MSVWTNVRVAESSDPTEIARAVVEGFYELGVEHRELFHAVVVARVNRGGDPGIALWG